MCTITNQAFRDSALACLTGVVSAHLSKRCFSHSIVKHGEFVFITLETDRLSDLELERIIRICRGFNAQFWISTKDAALELCLFL